MQIANPRIELYLKQNKIKSKFYFFNRSWDTFLSSHSRYFIGQLPTTESNELKYKNI